MIITKIIDHIEIDKRVKDLGNEISTYYKGESIVLLCILKGSVCFAADLMRYIDIEVELEFLTVSSYNGSVQKKIKSNDFDNLNLKNKNILIVEDIVDTGNTIMFIKENLEKKGFNNIKIVSFLFKPDVYKFTSPIDWVGFKIDNQFVIGYGLDYNGKYRNKRSLYKIDEKK